MRLPKYKQPILDLYNNTDFSQYNLSDKEKEMYDKTTMDCLKISYSVVPTDYGNYYKDNKDVLKSLIDKGLIMRYGNSALIRTTLIHNALEEQIQRKKARRAARNAR